MADYGASVSLANIAARRRVCELAPDNAGAHNNKGNTLQRRGDLEAQLSLAEDALQSYAASVESFNKALQLAPDDVEVHNNKGIVLLSRGELRISLGQTGEACSDLTAALGEWSRSLDIAPNDKQARELRQAVEKLIDERCREKQS